MPLFLDLSKDGNSVARRRIAYSTVIAFTITLLVSAFLGEALLSLFGISILAFRIAGGILLLVMALGMVRPQPATEGSNGDRVALTTGLAIVPLAIPLLAGPGSISTVIIYANLHASWAYSAMVAAVIPSVAGGLSFLLRLAPILGARLPGIAMLVFSRVMGLIIAAIAVEFFLYGCAEHLLEHAP